MTLTYQLKCVRVLIVSLNESESVQMGKIILYPDSNCNDFSQSFPKPLHTIHVDIDSHSN